MGVFDIIGPVMIGPSSSHTAGALRIGQLAALIFKQAVTKIEIYFHGSFACTHQGHGTDRAIIAGILGMRLDDENIIHSLEIAGERGVLLEFNEIDLGDVHPNTVKIILYNGVDHLAIVGSSIGGGNIVISQIGEYDAKLKGKLPALWVIHEDKPGEIAAITSLLGQQQINIAFMRVFRKNKGGIASSIIELDNEITQDVVAVLEKRDGIKQLRFIPSLYY